MFKTVFRRELRKMPLKLLKEEDDEQLKVHRILYAKNFRMTVDKNLCKGCVLCTLTCPREAITLKPVPKDADGITKPSTIDVDVEKCDYHGECAVICPFGAIKIHVDGQEQLPVFEKDAFPTLIRDISIDSERCEPDCTICADKCPLDVITVRFEPLTSDEIADRKAKGLPNTDQRTVVEVNTPLCAACGVCEVECPVGVIQVPKFIEGVIRIDQDLCPEGCQDCYDVCPVDALEVRDDGKVYVNDRFCIYCGACVNVCPRPEALELSRTAVRHTPIKSGAWNKALEAVASTMGLKKELKAKRAAKAREALENRRLS
jgi:4Fe-4S ferredoxin